MGISSDEGPGGATPEYERQRRVRIQENRAKLDALGLPGLSASLHRHSPLPSKHQERRERTKKKSAQRTGSLEDNDEDYQPSDSDRGREAEGTGESSSDDDECEEKEKKKRSRRKEKQKGSSKLSKLTNKTKTRGLDELLDDDFTLKQAIDLSIGERLVDSSETLSGFPQNSETIVASSSLHKKDSITNYRPSGRQKNKIVKKSRIQLTEDEMVAYFFTLDEVGKGYLTLRDLHRLALAHDFSWTEDELFSMIQCFDSDGDGKLSLEDFRTIVCRCNILQDEGRP
ncbi:uncharacterized protein LOC121981486 isoform X1 [Zingiber officinale]|uniref:uncharacterized protein LOC121981486 isoform X1 n=1 Tax=Zingiber officinale TaxID=94328 RepID=UPI001C4D9C5C|nr:uncharacterized protein LOC121981486 isoform X1 [Zingiber officinale]XP_042389961.1 uncharacterized protein LOC121981486 isoform X1 [Zingiber officinale]XP_042389962.1 uncharacterized protein LOC121981486 isoform X1 [Zingiber officinale]